VLVYTCGYALRNATRAASAQNALRSAPQYPAVRCTIHALVSAEIGGAHLPVRYTRENCQGERPESVAE
jgi:hypothetical protein